LLEQYYGGQNLVDADNLTAALNQVFDNSSQIAQVAKNSSKQMNTTSKSNQTAN
jgi:hypothetical protein